MVAILGQKRLWAFACSVKFAAKSFDCCPNETARSINWLALEAEFDWLQALADCPQKVMFSFIPWALRTTENTERGGRR